MPGIFGGLMFLAFLSVNLLLILSYIAHEQGDYRNKYFNWFLMRESSQKPTAKPRQPHQDYKRRNGR
jgi:hypothetical protein